MTEAERIVRNEEDRIHWPALLLVLMGLAVLVLLMKIFLFDGYSDDSVDVTPSVTEVELEDAEARARRAVAPKTSAVDEASLSETEDGGEGSDEDVAPPDRNYIQVVDRRLDVPLPQVSVHLFLRPAAPFPGPSLNSILSEVWQHYLDGVSPTLTMKTDGAGCLEWDRGSPEKEGDWVALVDDGVRLGALLHREREISREDQPKRFPVEKTIQKDLLVLHDDGTPAAGQDVCFENLHEGEAHFSDRVRTDALGRARLMLLPRLHGLRATQAEADLWRLRAIGIFREPVFLLINHRSETRSDLTLKLPPCNRAIVRGVDEAGQPQAIEGEVVLRPEGVPANYFSTLSSGFQGPGHTADLGHVEIGMEIAVKLTPGFGDEFSEIKTRASVSNRVNTPCRIDVPLANTATVFVARLLDDEGAPLTNTPIKITDVLDFGKVETAFGMVSDRKKRECAPYVSDGAGQLRIIIRHQRHPHEKTSATSGMNRYLRLQTSEEVEALCPRRGKVDIDLALERKTIDLGDILLTQLPVIAAGRVVDVLGTPLPNTEFSFMRTLVTLNGNVVPRGLNIGSLWAAPMDLDGRFELRGELPEQEPNQVIGLHATCEGYSRQTQEIELGAQDLKFTLLKEAKVTFQIKQPGRFAEEEFQADYRRPDLPFPKNSWTPIWINAEGRAVATALAPGNYDLRVRTVRGSMVREFSSITLAAGQTRDLGDIDPALALAHYTLRIVAQSDANSRGEDYVWNFYLEGHDEILGRGYVRGAEVTFFASPPPLPVLIGSPAGTYRFEVSSTEQTLRLPDASHRVRIDFRGRGSDSAPLFYPRMQVLAVPLAGGRGIPRAQKILDGWSDLELPLPRPGEYRLFISHTQYSNRRTPEQRDAELIPIGTISCPADGSKSVTHVVEVDEKLLRRLGDSLRRSAEPR
jgi:hypothetical protein